MRLNFTAIRTFPSVVEASIACSMLQAEGVNAFLHNEELVRMDWWKAIAYGGVKLVVPEKEASNAIEILGNTASIPLTADDSNLIREGDYFNQFEPDGATNTLRKIGKSIIVILFGIVLRPVGVMFVMFFLISPLTPIWNSKSERLESIKCLLLMFLSAVISLFLMT